MSDARTEAKEKQHLSRVQQKLILAYEASNARVRRYAKEIQEQKNYLWENRSDMDHAEKVSTRQAANQMVQSGEAAAETQRKLLKLMQSPYFGRIDFKKINSGSNNDTDTLNIPLNVYVGIHTFVDADTGTHLIYDWRAPVSTLFYDYELGPAHYDAPQGRVTGEVTLKRQYRIRNGKMAFMLESGLNIMDDVLQEELSRTSDDRMKNIVATIQRDQNAIIRNEDAAVLIIQGAAGSGKTSIALHRVAFLLYRHKDTLRANDILIISPNKVFSDFISNVLPELGEEPIAEMGMEQLAEELLERKIKFQTFFEQTAALLDQKDPALAERISAKSTMVFQKQLDAYVAHVEATRFTATDVWVGNYAVPAWIVEQAFNKRVDLPLTKRVNWAAEVIEHEIWVNYRYEVATGERKEIKDAIRKMYQKSTLRAVYKEFFAWWGKPTLFKMAPKGKLEHADVFPLIYLKMRLEGISSPVTGVKHLVIDEMQDYTPVQYAVMAKLFSCEKTILGDSRQTVNPHSASNAARIEAVFPQAELVQLKKSYRSSYEITTFANQIVNAQDIIAIQRHGENPQVFSCKTPKDEYNLLVEALRLFKKGSYRTMGIICKTQKQAIKLHKSLTQEFSTLHLLSPESTSFNDGITICSAHLAKGLEFDEVFIPAVGSQNYSDEMERHLLYVACTRAMHRLTLTHVGPASNFITNDN